MSTRLQEYIKPLSFCDRGEHLQGTIPLAGMNRLAASLCHQNGEVEVDLAFDIDPQAAKVLRGHLKTSVALECQRCMKAVETVLESEVSLAFVDSEAVGKQLPSEYEPYLLDTPAVILRELVEDELILALPIVAFHLEDECEVAVLKHEAEAHIPLPDAENRPNPFKALAGLKKTEPDSQ